MITGLLFAAALTAQTLPGQTEKVLLWDSTHCAQLADTVMLEKCRKKVSEGVQFLVEKSALKPHESAVKKAVVDSTVSVEEKALAGLKPITPADSAMILFARDYNRKSAETNAELKGIKTMLAAGLLISVIGSLLMLLVAA